MGDLDTLGGRITWFNLTKVKHRRGTVGRRSGGGKGGIEERRRGAEQGEEGVE